MLVCCKIGPLTMDPESGRSIHRKERKERIGKELRTSKASPGRGASFGFNNLVSSCLCVLCVLCGEFNFCFLIEAFAIRSPFAQSLLEKGFASSCIHTDTFVKPKSSDLSVSSSIGFFAVTHPLGCAKLKPA